MLRGTERERSLLRATLLLVTTCAAEGGIEAVLVECLLELLGLHGIGVHRGTVRERTDAAGEAVRIDVHAK
mgnify:CR=1 FL=1